MPPLSLKRSYSQMMTPSTFFRAPSFSTRTATSLASSYLQGYLARQARKYGFNGLGASTKTTSGIGVTNQYDRKQVYRKKRMPRRKRRRWVKFVKKVGAVTEKDFGTNTIVRSSLALAEGAIGQQGFAAVTLYGKDGVNSGQTVGNGDIANIFSNDLNTKPSSKFKFCSAVLDVTAVNDTTSEIATDNLGIEVDVYELMYRKVASCDSPVTMWSSNGAEKINAGALNLALTQRGVTPFDLPDILSRYGVTIVKKVKYFLAKGQQFTYQIRNPKSYTWQRDFINDGNDDFMIPYVTKTLLFVIKGLPGYDLATPKLNIGTTRKYMYKEMEQNDDADNYF